MKIFPFNFVCFSLLTFKIIFNHYKFILFFLLPIYALLPQYAWGYEPIEPEMLTIPAGSFISGVNEHEASEYLSKNVNAKEVYLPAFKIGLYEVSNIEYFFFIEDGGYQQKSLWSDKGWAYKENFGWRFPRRWEDKDYNDIGMEKHPVSGLSWYEAEAYCNWLTKKTGKPFRLPNTLEWEKAARGQDGLIFPWGDEWQPDNCNWLGDSNHDRFPDRDTDGYIYTAPVDAYPHGVSPYGLFNMAGNVLEWCADIWPDNPGMRQYRGGDFMAGEPRLLRCSWQGGTWAEVGHVYWGTIGFRVVMDLEKQAERE